MALVRFDVFPNTHGYLSSDLPEAAKPAVVRKGDVPPNAVIQTLQKDCPR